MSKQSTAKLLSSSATASRQRPASLAALGAVVSAPSPLRSLSTTNAAKAVSIVSDTGPRNLPDEVFIRKSPPLPSIFFDASVPFSFSNELLGSNPNKPPDERKVKLGKTLRILQDRLPTLLEKPLPQEILSPNISLHLFPSTHPHLPVVSGRVAYIAALWTSPIAWNRVPIIGNVRLEVLSARMVEPSPCSATPRRTGAVGEQLVIRWRTIGKGMNWGLSFMRGDAKEEGEKSRTGVRRGGAAAGDASKEFTGLFIFEFDKEGRILSHTIEHVDQSGQWDRGVGAKVVGLADWLIGGIKGRNDTPLPAAFSGLRIKRGGSDPMNLGRDPPRRSSVI